MVGSFLHQIKQIWSELGQFEEGQSSNLNLKNGWKEVRKMCLYTSNLQAALAGE